MQRISTATRVPDLFGPGRAGFRDGNLALGIAPTDLNAAWFNEVQEELMSIIEAASMTPSAGTLQLLAAIQAVSGMRPGTLILSLNGTAPVGTIKANGAQNLSRTVFARLFAEIGTTYGAGDGSTTFGVPDFRAEFIRGLDDGRGVDVGRLLSAWQDAMVGSHTHTTAVANTNVAGSAGVLVAGSAVGGSWPTSAAGGAENRPRNMAALICIKY